MASAQCLKLFINERLTAAAEEVFSEFEKTIVQYEEEIDRQRRLLDNIWKPQITQHTADVPQQSVSKEEDVLAGQQFCNQKRKSSLNQEDPEPAQMKECRSTCGETCGEILQSAATKETFTESEKTIVQCGEKLVGQHRPLSIIWKPETKLCKTDFPQQHMNQEVQTGEPPQIKEEQERLCTSQEGEQLVLRLESSEESDNSETKPDNDPFAFHLSTVTESRVQKRKRKVDLGSSRNAKLKPKMRHLKERSQNDMKKKRPVSKSHCDTGTKTERMPVKCDVCGKAFEYKSKMRYHRRTHTGEKPYACSTCGQKFTRMSSVKHHQRIHTGEKPYVCEICDKRFRGAVNLVAHTRTHTGERLYSCKTCGKTFTQRGHLLCHNKIHTGEKPHSCETCGKSFSQLCHLLRHMRIHTGEKPYSCTTCGKRFNQREILSVHMKTHTDQKPCICSICGKKFKAASPLMRHMRTHTGEKPYFCEKCGKKFTQHEHLLRHMKTHKG